MRMLTLTLCFAFSIASPCLKASTSPSPQARPTMQKIAENLAILLQNIRAFDKPPTIDEKNKVLSALAELKKASHDVQTLMPIYAVDPVMPYLSIDLPDYLTRIEVAYTERNYEHARYLLRQTTQLCIACHSASSNKSSAVLTFPEPVSAMSLLERAEYFAATRRHEEAMLSYEKFLADKGLKASQAELWKKAVQNLLAITIKLRNDPHVTYEMCSALLDEGGYSSEQRLLLSTWRSSAQAWAQETKNAPMDSAEGLNKASLLIDKGDQLVAKDTDYGFIEYMRASALLNELSMRADSPALKSRNFALAGQLAEKLQKTFFTMQPTAYYEACIRSFPHSTEAAGCWLKLEANEKSDLTSKLPPAILSKLRELGKKPTHK